jgi:hypothetical protein
MWFCGNVELVEGLNSRESTFIGRTFVRLTQPSSVSTLQVDDYTFVRFYFSVVCYRQPSKAYINYPSRYRPDLLMQLARCHPVSLTLMVTPAAYSSPTTRDPGGSLASRDGRPTSTKTKLPGLILNTEVCERSHLSFAVVAKWRIAYPLVLLRLATFALRQWLRRLSAHILCLFWTLFVFSVVDLTFG